MAGLFKTLREAALNNDEPEQTNNAKTSNDMRQYLFLNLFTFAHMHAFFRA